MVVLKWICFIVVCLDTLSYILERHDIIKSQQELSTKIAKFIGLLVGIAARVYVLCGAATGWLLV